MGEGERVAAFAEYDYAWRKHAWIGSEEILHSAGQSVVVRVVVETVLGPHSRVARNPLIKADFNYNGGFISTQVDGGVLDTRVSGEVCGGGVGGVISGIESGGCGLQAEITNDTGSGCGIDFEDEEWIGGLEVVRAVGVERGFAVVFDEAMGIGGTAGGACIVDGCGCCVGDFACLVVPDNGVGEDGKAVVGLMGQAGLLH